jgi:predicted TIM-barrel fold metal-dependent hydrolase
MARSRLYTFAMHIIDSHVHIGFGGAIDARPASLVASMRKAGIAKAMVFAGRINQCSTEALIEAVAPHRDRLFPVGAISPLAKRPSLKTVGGWLEKGQIHAMKFYPGYEYFYPYDKVLRPYLKLLAEFKRPAIFHSGDTYSRVHVAKLRFAHPLHIDEIATEMPELPIVIAHMGYPWQVDAAEVVYKNKNVHADCSGFVYGAFDAKHRTHFADVVRDFVRVAGGTDRLLFGTDWPISDQSSYVAVAKKVFGADAGVFSKSAIRIFGV